MMERAKHLKGCPFCGEKPWIEFVEDKQPYWAISCYSLGQENLMHNVTVTGSNREAVERVWDYRGNFMVEAIADVGRGVD